MSSRARSLAAKVAASLASTKELSSFHNKNNNDERTNIEQLSLKRIDSFASHIRRFSIASSVKQDIPDDDDVSSPRTDEAADIENVRHENVALASESETNQCFTYDVQRSRLKIEVLGPGGVAIPQLSRLKCLLPNRTVSVMCLTWNVASRSQNSLSKIKKLITNKRQEDRADLICLCFQELPPSNAYYHQETVKLLAEAVADTHLIFCWVRKWSQMMVMFIREPLVVYTSTPEWQFISSTPIVKPVRTKGAIGVCFRIFQTSVIFVTCHMTHGSVMNRIYDYSKISESLRFSTLKKVAHSSSNRVTQADCVFWFGDLNFRLRSRKQLDALSSPKKEQKYTVDSYFDQLLIDDELTLERCKGTIFEGFSEAYINFPPTHKFVLGTNDYVSNRIPSYTDRILYHESESDRIKPIKYDCLWEENSSDHKPVFGLFTMRVLDHQYQSVK